VAATLDELNTHDAPVILALNKMDALSPELLAAAQTNLADFFSAGVKISALKGQGVPELLERVGQELYSNLVSLKVIVPYRHGQLISLFHEQAIVEHVEHRPEGVELHGRVPERLAARFKSFVPKKRRMPKARSAAG